MPNWEGIEDGSPEAARVWLARPTDDEIWTPLRKSDCHTLNRSSVPAVHIECGRSTAYPNEGVIGYNFFRGAERKLCSAIWFRKEENGKDVILHPIINAADSDKIESLYQSVITATSSLGKGLNSVMSQEAVLEDGSSKVTILKSANTLKLIVKNKGWFASLHDLQRGYGEYNVDGEENEILLGPVKHLVFVVHGIGEAYFSREEVKASGIIHQMNDLRKETQQKQVDEWRLQCKKRVTGSVSPPGRIEFLPIEWFHLLHDDSSSLMKSLRLSTLQTIPALRAIANDVVFDVLMYLTPTFCQATLECVISQIIDLYNIFKNIHPEFDGKCSLIGHSLGSVICWDLLSVMKEQQEQKDGARLAANPDGVVILSGADKNSVETAAAGSHPLAKGMQEIRETNDGHWGPALVKSMEKSLPFVPECTILLGSPLGIFLTLRGAHKTLDDLRVRAVEDARREASAGKSSLEETVYVPSASPFTLPTKSFYNIYHPSDPVACKFDVVYRLRY
jgi:hypothetical protein